MTICDRLLLCGSRLCTSSNNATLLVHLVRLPRNIASGRDALGHTEHTNLSLDLRHRNSTFLCSLAFFSSFLSKQENGWLARSRAAECPTDLATDLRQFTSTNQVQNLLTSSCTIMHSTACNKLCYLQVLKLSL